MNYRVRHPNGQYVIAWITLPEPNSGEPCKFLRAELTDDRLKASRYRGRSEAREVFAAFPGVELKMEIV